MYRGIYCAASATNIRKKVLYNIWENMKKEMVGEKGRNYSMIASFARSKRRLHWMMVLWVFSEKMIMLSLRMRG